MRHLGLCGARVPDSFSPQVRARVPSHQPQIQCGKSLLPVARTDRPGGLGPAGLLGTNHQEVQLLSHNRQQE